MKTFRVLTAVCMSTLVLGCSKDDGSSESESGGAGGVGGSVGESGGTDQVGGASGNGGIIETGGCGNRSGSDSTVVSCDTITPESDGSDWESLCYYWHEPAQCRDCVAANCSQACVDAIMHSDTSDYRECVRQNPGSEGEACCGAQYPDAKAAADKFSACYSCFCAEICQNSSAPACIVTLNFPSCTECAAEQCAVLCNVYNSIPGMNNHANCINRCGYDSGCREYCAKSHPEQGVAFQEYWDCALERCEGSCSDRCSYRIGNSFISCDFCRENRCLDECAELSAIEFSELGRCKASCGSATCRQLCEEQYPGVNEKFTKYQDCIEADCPICFALSL